jgi:hypothetical protein
MDTLARGLSRGSSVRLWTTAPVALVLALLVLPATRLCAQNEGAGIAPPAHRVRVTVVTPAGDAARYVGLASLRADTLSLVDDSGLRAIPVATIRQLELSGGRRGHGTVGGLLGLGVGLAAGLGALPEGGGDGSISGEVLMLPISMLMYSGLGYFIGSRVRTERWQEIPTDGLWLMRNGAGRVDP